MKALLVEDDEFSLGFYEKAARSLDCDIRTVMDGAEALSVFRDFEPDLVLTDIELPGMSGLELLKRIRVEGENVIVVIATVYDRTDYVIEALRLNANNYLLKPIQSEDLVALLRKYMRVVEERRLERRIWGMLERLDMTVRFENRIDLIPQYVHQLLAMCAGAVDPSDRLGVNLGLSELITNAIEHGNLGITYEEKAAAMEAEPDAWESLVANRLAEPERAGRPMTVEFHLGEDRCEWIIRDEGDGFNWRALPDPSDDNNVLRTSGRGILLSRFQFDELEFEGKGNVVRAVKRLKTRAPNRSGGQAWQS